MGRKAYSNMRLTIDISTSMVHKFIQDSLEISHIFPSKNKKCGLKEFSAKHVSAKDLDLDEIRRYYLLCSIMKIITSAKERMYALNHHLIKCEFSKNEVEKLKVLFKDKPDARKNCILTFATGIIDQFQVANASIGYVASSSLDSNYLKNITNISASQTLLKKIHNQRLLKQKSIEDTIQNNLEFVGQEICVTLMLLEQMKSNQLLPPPSVALRMLQSPTDLLRNPPDIQADSSLKMARNEAEMGRKNRSELQDKLSLLLRLYRYARQ
jgi:hypothetical protein